MRYRRDEAFRFQFQKPLSGALKLISLNGERVDFINESIEIIDISPNGLKFKSSLNLSIIENKYLLEVTFIIDEKPIRVLGTPAWKKIDGSYFTYGFNGIEDERTKQGIIQALKGYSKKLYNELKNQK